MRASTSTGTRALALVTSIIVAACGKSDAGGPSATATVAGVVRAPTGAAIEGASVNVASATATTGGDGRYEIQNLPVGTATITTSAPSFDPRSDNVSLIAGPMPTTSC